MQTVFENSLMEHRVALPPDAMGKITYIAPAGQYSLKVCLNFCLEKLIMLSTTSMFFSVVYLHFSLYIGEPLTFRGLIFCFGVIHIFSLVWNHLLE